VKSVGNQCKDVVLAQGRELTTESGRLQIDKTRGKAAHRKEKSKPHVSGTGSGPQKGVDNVGPGL